MSGDRDALLQALCKPLGPWVEARFCAQDAFYAETSLGTWMVVRYSGRGFRWAVTDTQGDNSEKDWMTPEEAQAAAEADKNARIAEILRLDVIEELVGALAFYAPQTVDGIKFAGGDDAGHRATAALARIGVKP